MTLLEKYSEELKNKAYYSNSCTPFIVLQDALDIIQELERDLNEKERRNCKENKSK